MISRRNFLKLAGFGSVAVATGYTTGKLSNINNSESFVVHGFIPADENVIVNLVSLFRKKVKSSSEPILLSDNKIAEIISRLHSQYSDKSDNKFGKIIYRIKKLTQKVDSDIIISDGSNSIYSLNDFNISFYNLRKNIRDKKADLLFTAEYKNENFISSLFKSNKKELVIENERGIFDRVSFDKNYKNILINGSQGKMVLSIDNGIARVHQSSCKNGICKHSLATDVGSIMACAPNKVLIKVV